MTFLNRRKKESAFFKSVSREFTILKFTKIEMTFTKISGDELTILERYFTENTPTHSLAV